MEVVALESAQLGLELVAVLRGLEPGDTLLRGREGDAVALLAGAERGRGREVGLAGAGGPISSTLPLSSTNRSVASSLTSVRSRPGWAS
jgi:hypothetical protein